MYDNTMDWAQPTTKLEQARFFLNHLNQEELKTVRPEPQAFRFYLSAFLTPAYSVMYLLNDGAKDVLQQQRAKLPLEDRELLNDLWGQRDLEVHGGGAEVITKEKAIPAEQVPGVQVFGPPVVLNEDLRRANLEAGLPPGTLASVRVLERYFEFNGDHLRTIHLCDRLLRLLENLVLKVREAQQVSPVSEAAP